MCSHSTSQTYPHISLHLETKVEAFTGKKYLYLFHIYTYNSWPEQEVTEKSHESLLLMPSQASSVDSRCLWAYCKLRIVIWTPTLAIISSFPCLRAKIWSDKYLHHELKGGIQTTHYPGNTLNQNAPIYVLTVSLNQQKHQITPT